MDYRIATSSLHEPVSLERAKRHLRIEVEDTENDDLLRSYLRAVRQWCEYYSGRAFLWQHISANIDSLVDGTIILPRPPLIAISSIAYIDQAGATQTVDSSLYNADVSSVPGRIVRAYNQDWPDVRGHHHDVTISYIAGHSTTFTRTGSTLVVAGHIFNLNDIVCVYNIGGALPAGLVSGTEYYVRSVTGNIIELATTEAGSAVAMTDAGTGTHYIDALPAGYNSAILLRLTELWMHRGDEDIDASKAVKDLLSFGRMVYL